MTFLHASLAFAGLACVAIPILIHLLFRRRRKPVRWGAMRFLLEAFRKQRRRLRFEQFLLLLTRCLLLACLALALGRPMLGAAGLLGRTGRTIYILLDNSLASSAIDPGGESPAIDRHKRAAGAMLDALGPNDRAALILLGKPAEPVVLPPSSDLAGIKGLIERAAPTDSAGDWSGALRAAIDDIANPTDETTDAPIIVALSDFTIGGADIGEPLPAPTPADSPALRAIRIAASRPNPAPPGNVQITRLEPLRSLMLAPASGAVGETQVVRVGLRRTGAAVAEAGLTTLRVSAAAAGGQGARPSQPARAEARWNPGQSEAIVSVQFEPLALAAAEGPGAVADRALIAEIDRDAIGADNVFRRPISVRESIRVGVVDRQRFGAGLRADRMSAGEWLRLALRPQGESRAGPIETVALEPSALDAGALAALDAAFILRPDLLEDDAWGRLRRFADAGGLVLVAPPADANVHVWTDAFIRRMGLGWRIAREPAPFDPAQSLGASAGDSPLLALVRDELPELLKPVRVSRALLVEDAPPAARALLSLADGRAWLLAAPAGSGEARPDSPDDASAQADPDTEVSGVESGLVLYLASAPELSWTDLPAKPLMVPLAQELTRQGVGQASAAWSQVAGAVARAPRRASSLVEIDAAGAQRASIAIAEGGMSAEPLRRAGLFRAIDERGSQRGLIGVNPDADAGRTEPQTEAQIGAWLAKALGRDAGAPGDAAGAVVWLDGASPASFLEARTDRSSLSLPLLAAALAFAALETLLARAFSHAASKEPAPSAGRAGGITPEVA